MGKVSVEKLKPEEVTFDLALSLQKLSYVALAGLSKRKVEERIRIFNPLSREHVEDARKAYRQFAEINGLVVARTRHMSREEAVGFVLMRSPESEVNKNNTLNKEPSMEALRIEQFTILPCATLPVHEVGAGLMDAVLEGKDPELQVTATVLAENLFALRALTTQGFVHDTRRTPKTIENYFGKDTLPAIQYQLTLPQLQREPVGVS